MKRIEAYNRRRRMKLGALSRNMEGRDQLRRLLLTHQTAKQAVDSLLSMGAMTPENVQEKAAIDHNIGCLESALAEFRA